MGIKERKEIEKEQIKKRILDAALTLLSEEGYENFSIRKIADRIDYSPTTIYLYFDSKSDLLLKLVKDAFKKFLNEIDLSNSSEFSNPIDKLKEGMKIYINMGLENPNFYKSVFIHDLGKANMNTQFFRKDVFIEMGFDKLSKAIEDCIKEGYFGNCNVRLITYIIWTSIHGLTLSLIIQKDISTKLKNDLINGLIETLFNGLLKN